MWMVLLEKCARSHMRQMDTTTCLEKYAQCDGLASYDVRDETVSITSSHLNTQEVSDMSMCRWACGHTLRYHGRNVNIRKRLEGREHKRRVRETETEVAWTCDETRPRIRQKTDNGDGTTFYLVYTPSGRKLISVDCKSKLPGITVDFCENPSNRTN